MSEKLTEQINFGATENQKLRADKIFAETGVRATQIARAGFEAELKRYETRAGAIDPETLRLLAEAVRLGVNVPCVLREALQQKV